MRLEARLIGHAVIPAEARIEPPADAPTVLRSAGKFAGPDAPGRRGGAAGPLPVEGQPLQGLSSLQALGGGRYLATADNGFGRKANSADAMLVFHVLSPDFSTGEVTFAQSTFLSDPGRLVPYPIAMEGSDTRYLTGSDFDIEGAVTLGERTYLADEFGPFLLSVETASGAVLDVIAVRTSDGAQLRGPDHPELALPSPGEPLPEYRAARSRGIEGLALTPDARHLLAALEGPLWDPATEEWERLADGRPAARVLEFDVSARAWTGWQWLYPLERDRHAIGDLTLLDDGRGLVIERDGGEGDAARACAGEAEKGCFPRPARFKRIYVVELPGEGQGNVLKKTAYVDLLAIDDTQGEARQGRRPDGRFAFPFATIEGLASAGQGRLVLVNDNNFPFSRGRDPDHPDDTEFILIEVPGLEP